MVNNLKMRCLKIFQNPFIKIYFFCIFNRDTKANSQQPANQEKVRRPANWQDDSLSSLSIDSEDDTNLLSQVTSSSHLIVDFH